MLDAAFAYAARVRQAFPCRPGGKSPLTARGLLDATTDRATIEQWWKRWPDANVAVRTGRESGIVVLDVDGGDGLESLRRLEAENGPLPVTTSVVTPRGGQHYHFEHPGFEIRNSAGVLGVGLDIRGDGGYVLVPPSVGADGRRYERDCESPPAPAPGWLLERLRASGAGSRRTPDGVWLTLVRDGESEGRRDQQLTRLVGHLLRRYVDVDLVAELAHLVNQHRFRPPMEAKQVDKIVDSICRQELRRRARKERP